MTVAWLGTFGAAAYGLNRLEPHAQRLSTADTAIEWVNPPDWLHDEAWAHVLPELEAHIGLDPRTDVYDDRVCPWVAERLAGSAWIERIRSVTKQQNGRVKIQAEFRKPFAMAEHNGLAYLVDGGGVRLPTAAWPSSRVNRAGWYVLCGMASSPPRPGQRWQGEDLAAGLKLARFLEAAEHVPFREEILAIDVGNFRGRRDPWAGRLQLITRNPTSYIHWGAPPGEEYDVEATAELKLAMLSTLYEASGKLPDAGPIDVRASEGIGIGR